jgi:hypothetical protein
MLSILLPVGSIQYFCIMLFDICNDMFNPIKINSSSAGTESAFSKVLTFLSAFDQNEIVRETCELTVRLSHNFKVRLYAVVTL